MSRTPPASVRVTCGSRDYAHVGLSLRTYVDQLKQYFALAHAWRASAGLYFNQGTSSQVRRKLLVHACLAPMASGFRARRSFELMWAQSHGWYRHKCRYGSSGLRLSRLVPNLGAPLLRLLVAAPGQPSRGRGRQPQRQPSDRALRHKEPPGGGPVPLAYGALGLTVDSMALAAAHAPAVGVVTHMITTNAGTRYLNLRRDVVCAGVASATAHRNPRTMVGSTDGINFALNALRALCGIDLSAQRDVRLRPGRPAAPAGRDNRKVRNQPHLCAVAHAPDGSVQAALSPLTPSNPRHLAPNSHPGATVPLVVTGYDHIAQKPATTKGPGDPNYGPRALVPAAEALLRSRLALTRTYRDGATLINFCFVPGHYNSAPRQTLRLSSAAPTPMGLRRGRGAQPGRAPRAPRRQAQARLTPNSRPGLGQSRTVQAFGLGATRVKSCAYFRLTGAVRGQRTPLVPSLSVRL